MYGTILYGSTSTHKPFFSSVVSSSMKYLSCWICGFLLNDMEEDYS